MGCDLNQILNSDILYSCDKKPVAGLESNVVLIDKSNIDYSQVTYDANNPLKMTGFGLLAGKQGYKIEGVENTHDFASELNVSEFGNAYLHKFIGKILSTTAENLWELQKIVNGQNKFVAVVERLWKGADNSNKDAFIVLGIDNGLYGKVSTWQPSANNGTALFELHSKETQLENYMPRVLLLGDYAATKAAFDNAFASN
jgi:hypothetical protein